MEEVNQFLCPHVIWEKIIVRAELSKEQLKRALPDMVVEKESQPVLICTLCNKRDDRTMIINHSQGVRIC